MPVLQIRKLRQKALSRFDKLLLELKTEPSSLKSSFSLVTSFSGEKGDSCSWTMIKTWLFRGAVSKGDRHLKPTEKKHSFFPSYSQHSHQINKQPGVLGPCFLAWFQMASQKNKSNCPQWAVLKQVGFLSDRKVVCTGQVIGSRHNSKMNY